MPTFKLDDHEIEFQPGETIIQAAYRAGVDIPHYCWHPGLSVAANCRMCLVEVLPPPGRGAMLLDVLRFDEKKGDYVKAKKPKLQPACQHAASDGLEVKSDTSPHVIEARAAVQEFLLLNHPVDCPICDQAGECRLQDYWLDHSGKEKRMRDEIVHKPKAVDFGPTIVYDAERCIVCTRCVRFCEEVALDPVLDKRERGNIGEIVLSPGRLLDNAYTLMTEHVCPVGALTSKDFRFKARVWFLRSVDSVCQGCATGCSSYTDYDPRNGKVQRVRPRDNLAVNKYWMCDEGMLDHRRVHSGRVLEAKSSGAVVAAEEAISAAAEILGSAGARGALVLSAEHSSEDNYALIELGRQLGFSATFVVGRPAGEGDKILRHTDKNSNRSGVSALVAGSSKGGAAELNAALEAGSLGVVLALGSALEVEVPALRRVKVVALSVHEGPLAAGATVLLPASGYAEADGTFVNFAGIRQVSVKAIPPLGASRPAWKWALALAEKLGKTLPFKKAAEVKVQVGAALGPASAGSDSTAVGAQA